MNAPTLWLVMNWLVANLVYYGPPLALFLTWLFLRPVLRGLRVPRKLRHEARLCGNCQHGCAEPIPERCPECGHAYATAGVLTPALLTRTREPLHAMLVGWLLFVLTLGFGAWVTAVELLPDSYPPSQWTSGVAVAAEREHLWDRDPSPSDNRYDVVFDVDAVSMTDPMTGTGGEVLSASYTMNIVPEIGPAVLVEWMHDDDAWTATGAGDPQTGEGFELPSLLRLYQLAGLDTADERVANEIELLQTLLDELQDDPYHAVMNNGVWNTINGMSMLQQQMQQGAWQEPADPVLNVSHPWLNHGWSGGGNSREMEFMFHEATSGTQGRTTVPGFSQEPVLVWGTLEISNDDRFSNNTPATDFVFSMSDRTGWPVRVSVDLITGDWTLRGDPETDEQTGDEVLPPDEDGSVWRLAWETLGRDPDDGHDRLALVALHDMYTGAVEDPIAALDPHHQMQQQMVPEDFEPPTPGGFTHSNRSSNMMRTGMWGTNPPPGYVSPEQYAAYITGGVALLIFVAGLVLIVMKRRRLVRASSATIPTA